MLLVLIILILVIAIFSLVVYFLAFYHKGEKHPDPYDFFINDKNRRHLPQMTAAVDEVMNHYCERVETTSFDSKKLVARLYIVNRKAPIVILMHGYKGHALSDVAVMNNLAIQNGYNVLLPDQRSCGRSGGSTVTFGIKESKDLYCWVEYCVKTFGINTKILLGGISLGAATVLMSLDKHLPHNVKGVFADCGFSTPMKAITDVMHQRKMPAAIIKPFVVIAALCYGRFNIFETSAEKAITKSQMPIWLIHGGDDTFVPTDMINEIYSKRPKNTKLLIIDDASHGCSCYQDPERYKEYFEDFLHSSLTNE